MNALQSSAVLLLLAASTRATERLLDQNGTFQVQVPSQLVVGGFPSHEAADDFELVGAIERVVVDEVLCFNCQMPSITGAWLRFYDWTMAGPGTLQFEHYFALGDPLFSFDAYELSGLELRLPVPFQAIGRHFVAIQVELATDTSVFGIDTANNSAPNLSRVRWRDRAMGTPWTDYVHASFGLVNADLAIELWGTDATPPVTGNDPCGDWEELSLPLPQQSNFAIASDVEVIAPDDVWASVRHGHWYTSNQEKQISSMAHFDGQSWTYVPTPNPEPYLNAGGVYLYDVEAAGPNDVWAAGSKLRQNLAGGLNQQLFVLRWNGAQWTEVPMAVTAQSAAWINGIHVVAPDDVWLVGSFWGTSTNGITGQAAMAMHWDGSSFTRHSTPWPFNSNWGFQLYGVSVLSPTEAWAVGGDILQKPYVLRWDGGLWSFVDVGLGTNYNTCWDVVAHSSTDIWITGSTTPQYQALVLHGNGTSWTQSTGHGGGMDFHAYGPSDIYLGGSTISRWDGGAWSLAHAFTGIDGVSIAGIDSSDPCATFAVGRKYSAGMIVPFAARVSHPPIDDYCSGDGTAGVACPCSGVGATAHGCPNSVFAGGARLVGTGTPRVGADDVVLVAQDVTGSSAVFFQGTGTNAVVLDDGIGCVGGTVLRLGTKPVVANTSAYPAASDPQVSVRGQIPAPGATRYYQCFYRNSAALFCPPATSNRTNGLAVVWSP